MRLFLFLCLPFLSACTYQLARLTPIQIPMHSQLYPHETKSDRLIILLPGAMDSMADLEREGFVRLVREAKVNADVLLVDAHIGYYSEMQIIERLNADIISSMREKYREIWLTGISLGGYGTMLYAREGKYKIDGVFVMAAFLGSRDVPAAIEKAGGLAAWQPGDLKEKEVDKQLWAWLKNSLHGDTVRRLPKAYIGYGVDDRFVQSNRLLARELPPQHVFEVPGGHTWGPWRALWQQWLATEFKAP